ncbi:hypothetical protein C4564_06110 [Candidatus Microgenomates bacterium]|nr:MAG: hypothetical protein C4564_06110 [Candidatus Microgenomates bacterium]
MQDNSFYLPILKWKAGEKGALKDLGVELKGKVVPLVEFVKKEKQVKTEDKKIKYIPIPDADVFKEDLQFIKEKFSDMTVLVDTKLLTDLDRESAVVSICQKINLFEDKVYPVVYASEFESVFSQEAKNLLKEKGFCLRISGKELTCLETLVLEASQKQKIHLVIDFGITDESIGDVIPVLSKPETYKHWKSISLASGSFPKDLNEFSVDKVGTQPRNDWAAWKNVREKLNGSGSSINYGDYTIRYPIFENLHTPNTSCSFRYTGNDNWFVFRGLSRKAKNFPGNIQYRAHAVTIVDNSNYEYSGEDFSSGDMYIKSKAKLVDDAGNPLNKECGNSTTWIQAGVSHHICKVLDQLAN